MTLAYIQCILLIAISKKGFQFKVLMLLTQIWLTYLGLEWNIRIWWSMYVIDKCIFICLHAVCSLLFYYFLVVQIIIIKILYEIVIQIYIVDIVC